MKKLLKLLTLSLFVIAGSALLIGVAASALGGAGSPGPVISTTNLSNATSGITLLDQDKNGLTLRMNIGKVEFIRVATKEGTFILPRIPGFSRSFKVGEPCLPIASELISIPFKCKLRAKVIKYRTREVTLPGVLMPVQPPLSKSVDPAAVPFEINRDIYKNPGKYALPLVSTKTLGTLRATRLGQVFISPVEYYPTENRATVYKSVTVRIKFKNPNWNLTRKMQKRYASFYFEPVYRQLLNHKKSDYLRTDLVKDPVKYVIVADRMFESQLQPFIQWKTKKGFTVITGYTDTIGSSTTAIKTWLQNLYNTENPAPSFVLFVGDDQQIPAWSGSAGGHITDLKYCEFTGDDLPEIYYGRFSAQNTSLLQPQIDKTLEYEQYTMPDPGYLAEVTLVSGVDSGYADPYGNGQINYGTNYYFNAAHGISPNVWLYPASDGPTARTDIIQTVNDGIGFYNYTAHCSHSGPSDPSFTTSDVPSLTNANKYLLGIGNCCLSNTFGDNYSTPCFGEVWLQEADKGGIGWIGGTNSTYWDEDYWWGVGNGPIDGDGPTYEETGIGAYDGVFHDHGEPVSLHYTTNAAIIFAGNMAVTESGSNITDYYWEIYHLMGDPAVMTYMGVPSVNTVNHASSVTPTATSFNVQADPGSYAGITKNGVLHGAGYIDSSGSADIPITPFGSAGTATIVVTCQNKQPYEANIPITGGTGEPVADFTFVTNLLEVTFTDQSYDTDGTIVAWDWDFGDTNTSDQQNPVHTYAEAGTYTVTLTVTDNDEKTGFISKNVTVDDGLEPEVYVDDIAMSIIKQGRNYTATSVITIRDTDNNLVPNATVYITWSGVVGGSFSAETGGDGTVTFTSDKVKSPGPFTITVTNVTHATMNYNPALNNETSDSITY